MNISNSETYPDFDVFERTGRDYRKTHKKNVGLRIVVSTREEPKEYLVLVDNTKLLIYRILLVLSLW
jgi:hypothetical protein